MRYLRLGKTVAAHVRTWRPYTLWYVGLVGLGGATLAAPHHPPVGILAAWLVPTLIWVAGHYVGDYLDRDLDAISKPHRPIASGQLRPSTALACGAVLTAAACAVALAVNWRTAFLLAAGIAAGISYNAFFKAHGLWGNLVRGALTGVAFTFGQMMVVPLPVLTLLPFVLMFWAHDTASNLVGTLRDIAGDREGGYVTFAVRHGIRPAVWTATALYGLAVSTALLGAIVVSGNPVPYLVEVSVVAVLGLCALRLLFGSGDALTSRTALRAHEVLVAERLVLADALLAPGLGLPVALGILVPMLVVTLATQRAMRSRHEFPAASPHHPADGATPAFPGSTSARAR